MNSQASGPTYLMMKVGILVAAVAVYCSSPGVQEFVSTGFSYLRSRNYEGLRQFILAYGVFAPLTSIALMTAQSVVPLVPGIVITITNAWIFGWEYGALYSWIGALLGATVDFGIARWYGRPVVERFVSETLLERTDGFFRRSGVLAVFITRLTPIVPFKVISYGAGLTDMTSLRFVAATGLGQIPAILLYSYLGQHLTRNLRTVALATTLLVLLAVAVYYYRHVIEKFLSYWSSR